MYKQILRDEVLSLPSQRHLQNLTCPFTVTGGTFSCPIPEGSKAYLRTRFSLLHSSYLILALLVFQFLDFQLKPFVDPMPVEL